MNYKNIIKSREVRIKILGMLSWIPDKIMIKLQYRIKTGRKLNLKNTERYSEKLQWYKLYYRNPIMSRCVDKYEVRQYIKERGFEKILVKDYGVYDNPNEIDFEKLPKSFVLKDTLGGGGNSVIIVDDKDKCDIKAIKDRLNEWVSMPTKGKNVGREWVYENQKHRIVIEKNLFDYKIKDLPDYKFFCFDGKVYCSYMMVDYAKNHSEGRLGFLDRDFNLLTVHRADFKPMTVQPEKPVNYDEMVFIAEALSKEFPHVRVDFYNINGMIIFGEMTFFNASGYFAFEPDSFDYELGEKFVLPDKL